MGWGEVGMLKSWKKCECGRGVKKKMSLSPKTSTVSFSCPFFSLKRLYCCTVRAQLIDFLLLEVWTIAVRVYGGGELENSVPTLRVNTRSALFAVFTFLALLASPVFTAIPFSVANPPLRVFNVFNKAREKNRIEIYSLPEIYGFDERG